MKFVLGMLIIFEIKIIKGYFYYDEQADIALFISAGTSSANEFSLSKNGNLKACACLGLGKTSTILDITTLSRGSQALSISLIR